MPGDTFSHTADARAPIGDVWMALQEAETWAHIGPVNEVWDAEYDSDRLVAYRWSADAAGRRWEGTARVIEAIEGKSTSLALESPELKGTLTTSLLESGEGTSITVTLEARAVGMLATLFWGVVKQALGSGLPHQVEQFAATF